MGLFCLPKSDTKKDCVEAAINNLKLFLETSEHSKEHVTSCSQPYPADYLLDFARCCINDAEKAYKKEVDENPMVNPKR